ncbi:MAG: hypothetical protein ACRCW9_03955 [Cetobacterium sp.]
MLNKIKGMIENSKRYEWEGDFKALVHHVNQEIDNDSNWDIFEKLEAVYRDQEVKKMVYELLRTDGGNLFLMNMNLSMLIDDKENEIINKVEYMLMVYFIMYKSLKNGDLKL